MAYYIEIESDGTPKLNSAVYTTSSGSLLPLLDITDDIEDRFFGSGREIIQPRYYIKTTSSFVPLSGTVTTVKPTLGKFVDITRSYLRQTKIDSYLLDENAIYGLLIAGHSNSTGMSFQAAPSSFQNVSINNNKKVTWNSDASAMEVVDNIIGQGDDPKDRLPQYKFQPTFGGVYNPAVLVANELSRLIKEKTGKTIQFITISGATNGSCVDNGNRNTQPELSNNSIHFQYFQQGVQAAKDYADSISKPLKIPFMILINGEVEAIYYTSIGESEYRYRSVLNSYIRNLRTMVTDITGDTYKFPVVRHQLHGQLMTDTNNMLLKQYVLNSSRIDSPVVIASYQVSILSNAEHWDTEAIFRIYGSFVNNIFRHHYRNSGVIFRPRIFTVVGNEITITVNVPTLPLRIDTSRGLETNHGFTLIGADTIEISLTNVQVDGNKITMTAASNPVGATLYYKLKRPYVPNLSRPASYIADSEHYTYYGLDISNYLLSFKQLLS